MRPRLPAFAFLLLCCPAWASDQWVKLTSAHFELLTSAGERRGREAILHFEQVRSFFETVHMLPKSSVPVRIILFQSDKQYRPYRPSAVTDAFYVANDDRDYIVLKSEGVENFLIAIHEYTHLIVKHSGLRLPLWLEEGFADLCSTLRQAGGKVEIGGLIPGRFVTLRQQRWIDIRTLTSADKDSPLYNERDRAGVFYAESWALTHMVYLSDPYRPNIAKFLQAVSLDSTAEAAFQQVYAKTLDQVQTDLVNYMRGGRFKAFYFSIKLDKSAERPAVEPSPPFETGLALAELLMLGGKPAQAREMLVSLAHENPGRWEVEKELANLAWRDHKDDEARKHFARAEALGCTDPGALFTYAGLLQQAGAEDSAVAQPLRKALELKPEMTDARFMLGFVEMKAGHFAEALETLRLIQKVTPDRAFSYFHAIAYASLQTGDRKEAKAAGEQARKYARRPGESAAAAEFLAFLEHTESGAVALPDKASSR